MTQIWLLSEKLNKAISNHSTNNLEYVYVSSIQWVTGTWRDLKPNKLVPLPVTQDAGSSLTGLTDAVLVTLEQWTAAHCMFVISRGGDIP